MIRRRLWVWVAATIGVVAGVLALNLGFGNTPALGLDLQGGLSVILAPSEEATGDDLIVIRDLIRDELERRGIAEPDVRVEGANIIVDLPGVRDQRDALDAVDVAGIVTLRPVLQCFAASEPGATTTAPGATTATTAPGGTAPAGTVGSTLPSTTAATSSPPTTGSAPPATPSGFARPARPQSAPTTSGVPTTTAAPGPTTIAATGPTTTAATGPTTTAATGPTTTAAPGATPTTAPGLPADTEVLPQLDGSECLVGPPGGTGEVFGRGSSRADLSQQEGWIVNTTLSDSGHDLWNTLAFECNQGLESCPSRQLAIVLDDVIQSAPVVNQSNFPDPGVQITGMGSEGEARSLARVLNRGAFPVRVEAQTVQTVSPTLGEDSLRASVIAGMIGVVLVLLLLVIFYRRLTLLIVAGMIVWGMLIYSASAIISQTTNYALTLAGVTGIIVSIGVTVDSYVVYFERLKDEVRHGRTIKNSASRAFKASWRTILAADLVSILAAAVLFILSVGSVRGFALYLGVTTVCDLIVFFCFTRPAVALLASSGRLDRRDTFGLGVTP